MTDLLPCPFCGGEAQTLRNGSWWCVACRTPFCCDVGKFDTEAEAIAAWNTRAQTVFGMTLDEVRQMMKRDAERERTCKVEITARTIKGDECMGYRCSACGVALLTPTSGLAAASCAFNYCPNCGAKVVGE